MSNGKIRLLRTSPGKLVCLDIEGEWNSPLLLNAAELSGWECVFAVSDKTNPEPKDGRSVSTIQTVCLGSALGGCRHVIACETSRDSVSVYDLPAPRETTAVIVGNEEQGIARRILKRADRVISVPMVRSSLSSVNVAAAAAIMLYVLSKDLGRKPRPKSNLRPVDVDVLIHAPADPFELGSLLRSVYAFGWRRAFVSDPHRVWFAEESKVILESRAAARRARNPLAVLPVEQLDPSRYDAALRCDSIRPGCSLSKLRLPECQRLLIILGGAELALDEQFPTIQVHIDYANREVEPRFRHSGSILLSVISQMLLS